MGRCLRKDCGGIEESHQLGSDGSRTSLESEVVPINPPDDVEGLLQQGNSLFKRGEFEEATGKFQRLLELKPNHVAAHYNIGLARQYQGRLEEAIIAYRRALRFQPDLAVARNNLGAALKTLGRLDEAISCYRQVLRLQPDYADAHANLGNALAAQDMLEEAVASYRRALSLRPDRAETHYNLGYALSKHGRTNEASAAFQAALRLKPDHVEALFNLGIILHELGKLDEALTLYERALAANPQHAGSHINSGFLWLVRGDFVRGWSEFEWRWRTTEMPGYSFHQPRWNGESLAGKTILLYAEQGLGDTLQFIRYASLVKTTGPTIIVECQPPLQRLLAGSRGIDRLITRGTPFPTFDVHAPLLSLPAILNTTLTNIPAPIPYLNTEATLFNDWRTELSEVRSPMSRQSGVRSPVSEVRSHSADIGLRTPDTGRFFRVGIAWQGNPGRPDDAHRSIPLSYFARLSRVPGVHFVSLQKGPGTEQLSALANGFAMLDLSSRLDETAGPFMDTAAVMKNVDLVIAADTAVPHLAGALGIPVWLALSLVPDWRWLLERQDSPWYPTMRLFRQTRYGQWDDVFDRIAAELTRIVS
jgi:tetratricopeptide (TPR) repeat protein